MWLGNYRHDYKCTARFAPYYLFALPRLHRLNGYLNFLINGEVIKRSSKLECKQRQRDPFQNLAGGGTVGSGWREFDGGYPLLKLDPKAHRICYLRPWPKFGLVNFIQPKEQGPFAGCYAYQSLDFSSRCTLIFHNLRHVQSG